MFGVPGWRLGWIIVYNRGNYFDKLKKHLDNYLVIPMCPSSIVQHSLRKILFGIPQDYFDNFYNTLASRSVFLYD